jgi:hypothetical protein
LGNLSQTVVQKAIADALDDLVPLAQNASR